MKLYSGEFSWYYACDKEVFASSQKCKGIQTIYLNTNNLYINLACLFVCLSVHPNHNDIWTFSVSPVALSGQPELSGHSANYNTLYRQKMSADKTVF